MRGGSDITGHGLVLPAEPVDERRALAGAYVRYLTACCRRFDAIGTELPAGLRLAHRRVADLVRAALQRSPRQVLACFASPAVGTPLHCLALRDDLPEFRARIDAAAAAMIPHLLFEMALRGLLEPGESVLWPHGAPRLAVRALGGELVPPAAATGLRFSAAHVSAVAGSAEIAQLPCASIARRAPPADNSGFRIEPRFLPIGSVAHFATVDHNPIAAFEAHPDKAGNHIDLGGRAQEEWVRTLADSCALIERFMPGELAEMKLLLQVVVPVGFDAERHLSASYREAVGTIYLTLHPNVMTMTEAVVHEFQHNKLNVSAHSVDYLRNPFHPLYKSPVRPDPRPLWGILLAVHAFLPVAELYRRMRGAGHPWAARPDFERRLSEIDLKNHEGMEMLRAHADFTAAGRALFDDLESLEQMHLADRAARGLGSTPTEIHLA